MLKNDALVTSLRLCVLAGVLLTAGCNGRDEVSSPPAQASTTLPPCNHLESVGGSALFAPSPPGAEGLMPMQYYADIEAESLPTLPPADAGLHRVHLAITLFDKDGKKLHSLESPSHDVSPGGTQRIEGFTKAAVPPKSVSMVQEMKMELILDRCPLNLPAPLPSG